MPLPKVYEPQKYEDSIYKRWEESGAFAPINRDSKETFSIVLPPPNANGNLHVGHSLMFALQDVSVRYHRMKGKAVLWLPGADHAGFETQVVYEKQLDKKGQSRFDYSREELYKQIWDFVELNKENYRSQFRRLGASVDWSRFTYTLDKKIVTQAYKTFKSMWDGGLIYRGERLVNFCTFHGTAFADIEVEYKTEQGRMYYIHFPLVPVSGVDDKKDYVLIATTRPETMLGDVAVAVNPNDKRFKHLVGRTVKIPLAEREVPVIADPMVDMDFGTGAVKITAAHDPNDFDVARNHHLPLLRVITETGEIGHDAPHKYHGLTVEAARRQVVDELKQQKLLQKIEEHEHRVGHCYKCGTVIQPLVREQWFVDMKPLAKKAIKALEDDRIKFYPTSKQDQLITYLQGLKDWNISRQIAWGIPIPAFQNIDDPEDWIYDERVDQEIIEVHGMKYRRDPDVFDTWFSSSSWPYATLNYPDSSDFKKFYPNSLMETGGEILYPWVSRMIMLGLYVTGKIPFKSVYIHGYVMAEDGSKMSKSIGNVIDPMEIIDTYGSDALRMGLISGRAPAINRGFDTAKVQGARNFCNKLWNMARYIQENAGGSVSKPEPATPADHWVLSVLQHTSQELGKMLDDYRYAEGYELVYHTVWDDVADWYIEASKTGAGKGMLNYVLEVILKLAHPFAPFVTEAIWSSLNKDDAMLITQEWPEVVGHNKQAVSEFEEIKAIVTEVRQLATNLKLNRPTLLYTRSDIVGENAHLITKLARIGGTEQSKQASGVRLLNAEAWLDVDQSHISAYLKEVADKVTSAKKQIKALETRLSNKGYVAKAPQHVIQQTKDQLAENKANLSLLQAEHNRFS